MLNTNIVSFEKEVDSVTMTIAVNREYNDRVLVGSITMYVSTERDEDGDYVDGDLAVNWDTSKLTSEEALAIKQEFYYDNSYSGELSEILLSAGFSIDAVMEVCPSEWGMQQRGRASYDAYMIADAVREQFVTV